jgi:hypothetical protein
MIQYYYSRHRSGSLVVGILPVGGARVMGRWGVISRPLATRATITVVTAATAMTMPISMVMVRAIPVVPVLFLVPVRVGVVRHTSAGVTASLPPVTLTRMR